MTKMESARTIPSAQRKFHVCDCDIPWLYVIVYNQISANSVAKIIKFSSTIQDGL